jgi:protein tyrosine phosphatase (PTP) superfamily phosphohydrolase (DUF442 family)
MRKIRNVMHGISDEEDILDISRITDNLFISNWPIAKHVPDITSRGIELIVCTVRESQDKELSEPPLRMVQVPMTDSPLSPMPLAQLERGVTAALPVLDTGGKVLVFCKSGIHRSAAMASCILIGQGYSAEEAMQSVSDGREKADPYKPHIRKRIERFEPYWQERHEENDL